MCCYVIIPEFAVIARFNECSLYGRALKLLCIELLVAWLVVWDQTIAWFDGLELNHGLS
jgi:hypothetical protein